MRVRMLLAASAISAAFLIAGCSGERHDRQSSQGQGQHANRQSQEAGHEPQGEQGQEGQQSATQFERTDTYDHTRNGARLILNFDEETNSFVGTVQNTTDDVLTRVRVEVHLSNGTELGPTAPRDLGPGETMQISLAATEESFNTWSAHPEIGQEQANHQSDRE